jgi:hypothetical protein
MKSFISFAGVRCLVPVNLGGLGFCPDSKITDWDYVLERLPLTSLKAMAVALNLVESTKAQKSECCSLLQGFSKARFSRGVKTVPLEEEWVDFAISSIESDGIRESLYLKALSYLEVQRGAFDDVDQSTWETPFDDDELDQMFFVDGITDMTHLIGGLDDLFERYYPDRPVDTRRVEKLRLLEKKGFRNRRAISGDLSRANTFRKLLMLEKPSDWRTVPFPKREEILHGKLAPLVESVTISGEVLSRMADALRLHGTADEQGPLSDLVLARDKDLSKSVEEFFTYAVNNFEVNGLAFATAHAGELVRPLLENFLEGGGDPSTLTDWMGSLELNRPTLRLPISSAVLRI